MQAWTEQTELALTNIERDFLAASIAEHLQRKQQEAARKEREAALEKRAVQRLKMLVATLSIAVVTAIVLSGFALAQRNTAVTNANALVESNAELKSRNLASEAQNAQLENNAILAAALAVEANHYENTPLESQNALAELMANYAVVNRFVGHDGVINAVAFTPDGKMALSGGRDSILLLWDIQTGTIIRRFEGHTSQIFSIVISPDSQTAVSAGADAVAIVWNLQTGAEIGRFEGHSDRITDLSLSENGETVFSASHDMSVIAWDLLSQSSINRYEYTDRVNAIAVSSDNQWLVAGLDNGQAIVNNLQNGQIHITIDAHDVRIRSVAIAPDDMKFVTGSDDGTIREWNWLTGKLSMTYAGHEGLVQTVRYTNEGQVMSASGDNSLILWNVYGRIERQFWGHTDRIQDFDINHQAPYSISAGADGTLILWDMQNTWQIPTSQDIQNLYCPTVTQDGHTILVLTQDAFGLDPEPTLIYSINLDTGFVKEWRGHNNSVNSIELSSDGRLAVTAGSDKAVIVWDIASGEVIQRFTGHHNVNIAGAIFDATNNYVLSASLNPIDEAMYWRISDAQVIYETEGGLWIKNVDKDKAILASHYRDGRPLAEFIIIDIETGEELESLTLPIALQEDWHTTPSGDQIVLLTTEGSLDMYDIATGELVWQMQASQSSAPFNSTCYLAVTNDIIIVPNETGIAFYELETGKRIREYSLPYVLGLSLSNDNNYVAVSTVDGIFYLPIAHDAMMEWVKENRYISDFTCEEREEYRIEPLCSEETSS